MTRPELNWHELRRDLVKALIVALLVLIMCYILRGTDWEREQSVFTELNEHMRETAD